MHSMIVAFRFFKETTPVQAKKRPSRFPSTLGGNEFSKISPNGWLKTSTVGGRVMEPISQDFGTQQESIKRNLPRSMETTKILEVDVSSFEVVGQVCFWGFCKVSIPKGHRLSQFFYQKIMFWVTSISAVFGAGFVLRTIHDANFSKSTFYGLLTLTLLLFNLVIAVILATFWIDALPWSKQKMLLGLVAITLGLAVVLRFVWPVKQKVHSNHRSMLKTYSTILVLGGFFGGLFLSAPVFARDYLVQSDRWTDIASTVAIIEITSLYTLVLSLTISIGSSIGNSKTNSNIV